MTHDIVVVGSGVGGLTVAALLSARGLGVCLLERQSQVGGCIGRIEHSGYEFEPGLGLYTGWGPDEIFDRVFSELPVSKPATSLIDSEYVVRIADDSDIRLFKSNSDFNAELERNFPECVKEAIEFYDCVHRIYNASTRQPVAKPRSGILGRLLGSSPATTDPVLVQAQKATALDYATKTSTRFQRFVDAQLRGFLHSGINRCSFLAASLALITPRQDLYTFKNGVSELAERLAESIKKSGGVVRLNSPALRLAYSETGDAIGVDLLSGERVIAEKAIVSNLPVWDTYGRLIGLQRTPSEIKGQLQKKQSSGVYVIYAAVEETTVAKLPAPNFLVTEAESRDDEFAGEFTVSVGAASSDGKFPATIKTSTDVTPWFAYQTSEEDYEQRDQQALELLWGKLHQGVPELGAGIEVIETANPRSYYDNTRRKLGMVLGIEPTPDSYLPDAQFSTPVSNLYMAGDTIGGSHGIAGVTASAHQLADQLTK